MKTYFALFLIATVSSLIGTPVLRRCCERAGLVDEPRDGRRLHRKGVPRLGGVAIFSSVVIALALLPLVKNLLTQALQPDFREIVVLLGCGLLVLLLGVYDDWRGANATVKFAALSAITALFYALGGRIEAVSIPFVGTVALPHVVGFIVTLLWVVGIANAFNLIDGVDGLATGSALFSCLVLLTVSLLQGRALVAVVALALSGALAGFLRYNFNPASIFLGDSGSLFVGFSLAALSIQGAQKASTAVAVAIPLLAFGLPVVDTGVAIARRMISGKPIFQGDREHIHHMLLQRGWSQRRVVLVLYGVSALFGLFAMLFVNSASSLPAVMLFVVGVAVVIGVGHLRYHEVDELRASVKRNLGDRRTRAANNVALRRGCQSLATAASLEQLFASVAGIVDLCGFAHAGLEVRCHGQQGPLDQAVNAMSHHGNQQVAVIRDGCLYWSWKQVGFSGEDLAAADEFWTLRLPLANGTGPLGYLNLHRRFDGDGLQFNVGYLTTIFQPALVQAVERILSAPPRHMTAHAG